MRTLSEVITYASMHHNGQFRRDGVTPYTNHLQDVASCVSNDVLKKIAWLHDILEDTPLEPSELRSFLDEDEVFDAVVALTKPHSDIDYFEYLESVKGNRNAILVKISDLINNLKDSPTKNQVIKYGLALNQLGSLL